MKTLLRSLLLATLVLAAPARRAAAEADTAALKKLVTAYEEAIRSGEVSKSGIRKSLTDDFSAVVPSGQMMKNYGELSKGENALRSMVGRGTKYDRIDVSVDEVFDGNGVAGISGHTENHATAQGGKSSSFTTYWTAVAKQDGGVWKLARHQAVMDPANNMLNPEGGGGPGWSFVLGAAFICGLAGVVVGFILAKMLGGAKAPALAAPSAPAPAPSGKKRAWDSTPAATAETPEPAAEEPAPAPEPAKHTRAWDKPAAEAETPAATPEAPPADKPAGKRMWDK